jgi:hypothetical protein
MKEGNIISFKVFINSKGVLMTEYSKLPSNKVSNVFNKYETPLIKKILNELENKFDSLHKELEDELAALK